MSLNRTFALAIVALVPTLALAEPRPLQGACKNDMKTLCASVQPGGGRLRDCMTEHRAQLSEACKVAIADRMLERHANQAGTNSDSMKSAPKSSE
jgi:cysteine rich repeat protein